MLRTGPYLIVFALLQPLVSPASAHHSFAMFDRSRVIVVKGTLKELQWTNPHIWFKIVSDAAAPLEYSVEGGAPGNFVRSGWTKGAVKPGDKIEMSINPNKDGSPGGALVSVKLADGRVLGRA